MNIKSLSIAAVLLIPLAADAQITPLPADLVAGSIGVNVHPEFFRTATSPPNYVYADPNFTNIIIAELGVSKIRYVRAGSGAPSGDSPAHKAEYYARERAMRALGINLTLVAPSPTSVNTLDSVYVNSGGVNQEEGANEPDLGGQSCSTIIANQSALYSRVRSDSMPAVSGLPVLGPSLTRTNPIKWLLTCPTFTGIADIGNWHTYIHAVNPEASGWDHAYYANAVKLFPDVPIYATEYGYRSVQVGEVAGQNHVAGAPDAIIARYMPRWILTKVQIGYSRGFWHQIADNHVPSPTDPNSGYGLIDYFGTIKPQWTAMKNMISLFSDPLPVSIAPLNYTVTRQSGNLDIPQTMLFQRSDGHYMLPIWLGLSGWNGTTYTLTPVAPEDVSIQLQTSAPSVTINTFNDDGSISQSTTVPVNGLFTMTVTDHLQVLLF